MTPGTYTGLVSCPSDEDYFSIALNGGQFVSATVTFSDDEGDIDLRLKDSTDTVLVYGSSSSDNEVAAHGTDVSGTFYINARLVSDAGSVTGNTYDMEIEVGAIPTSEADCTDDVDNDFDGDEDCADDDCASDAACQCATDPFEPNNGADVAATLGLGTTNSNLSVCSNDDDWYSFSASGVITAALTFSDVEGDVDVRLYDAAEFATGFDPDNLPSSTLGYGTSVSDDETITYDSTGATTPPSGDYVLRVYLYADDDSTNCVTCAWGNTYGLTVTATP
ncbi:MAG: hypothetical protein CL928_13620 [Deltaproteobacteria bacterium]|nr:hypothetical protein [Deltaproteobacteria bacterium]